MLVIKEDQELRMEKIRRVDFVELLLPVMKKLNPEFLPGNDAAIRVYLDKKIRESKKWGLETDAQVEKYVYLCMSYAIMNERERPQNITNLLTWPGRKGHDKLVYLHHELINITYVANNR